MTSRLRDVASGGVALLALMAAAPALAQPAASGPGDSPPSSSRTTPSVDRTTTASPQLGEIVVTAQRRRERLQDVPVAVSAFDKATISQLHLNDALAVSKYIPSMISNHNAGLAAANTYYLRGLGNSQSVATFDPPVGTYVNDIYIARQNANNYAFFDTERVEVLRGPQGTLFGRNTTGGAVSIILAKPSDQFGGKFEATAGSYDRYTVKGTVDVPLNDRVRSKLSAFYITDGGYLKNITTGEHLNGGKDFGVRGDLRLLPTDRLTIDLSAEYTQNEDTYLGVRTLAVPSSTYKTATTPVFYETAAGMRQTSCNGDAVNILLSQQKGDCAFSGSIATSINAAYETDAGTLNYIGSYRHLGQSYINQYNANITNVFGGFILADNNHNDEITQELKWNGKAMDGRLRYVTGIFFMHEYNDDDGAGLSGTQTSTAFTPATEYHFHQRINTVAGYAQGDLDITPDLTFTAGVRYTYEKKALEFFHGEHFPTLGYTSAQVVAAGIPLDQEQFRWTPRFALNYRFTPNVRGYLSATNGFKSGGWNGNAALPAYVLPFKPEKTWSYEAGLKSELLDHRLRLNGDFFFANTRDLQVTEGIIPPGQTTIVSLARNAGELRVYGLEVESSAAITRELNAFVNFAVQHGEYASVDLTPGVAPSQQISTSTVPVRVPRFQMSSGLMYMKEVAALNGSVGGSVAYRHNAPYWVAVLNTASAPEENYVDLSVKYNHGPNADWGVALEVSNLTDQKTITANFLSLFPGDPRRITGRFFKNF